MIEAIPAGSPGFVSPADYAQSIDVRPEIPPDFDPLSLGPDERTALLREYKLPAEPDDPELHAFWEALFYPPLTYVTGALTAPPKELQDLPARQRPPFARVAKRTHQQSSGHWSGASIIARDGRMLTDVMATWVVPSPRVPQSALALDPGAGVQEFGSSCWVGLDGQRAYPDSTLPQMGTEQSVNKPGLPRGEAVRVWFQWWPMRELTVEPLPVRPGDRVYCWLTAVSYTRVRCVIKVVSGSEGRLMRFFADAPNVKYSPPLIPVYAPKISGATAEWVTEAQTDPQTQDIIPLANTGTVTFQDCYAMSAFDPSGERRAEKLIAPKLLRVYKIADNPSRRVTITTAHRPAPDAVETTFVG
jgi:hypothetical protein